MVANPTGDAGLPLPSFLIQNGMPDMSGDEINYIVNNYYMEEEYDEEMMEAFEEFSAGKK